MTFIQRRINVDATSWRCIDVDSTLSQRGVPAGKYLGIFNENSYFITKKVCYVYLIMELYGECND